MSSAENAGMSFAVAIDVSTAVTQRAGVGRYTRELVQALDRLPDGPRLVPFFVAPAAAYRLEIETPPAQIARSVRSWRWEILARQALRRPARGPWDGAQLYHAPDVVYPPVRGLPVVATVHDLSYIVYPGYHTRLNGTYLRLLTPTVTRRAALVIAVSEWTKRDLVTYCKVPAEKVRVVRSGVSSAFTRVPDPETIAAVRERHGLTEPFILSVGTLEPRKNLRGALSAYRLLRERLPDAPALALVGAAGWRLDGQRLIAPDDAERVRRLGFVEDADLAALYSACSAFVYPSFYEGWGLPVAEAMTLGAPVVTSNTSSLPEVAGDAALLVDPHSPEAIAAALESVLTDTATAARLRAAGPLRARDLTTEACAIATMRVYREAVEG